MTATDELPFPFSNVNTSKDLSSFWYCLMMIDKKDRYNEANVSRREQLDKYLYSECTKSALYVIDTVVNFTMGILTIIMTH